MDRSRIRRIFNDFPRSKAWAAKHMSVTKQAVSKWMAALRTGEPIPKDRLVSLEKLARQIEQTDGKCIDDVDGKSVKSQLPKLRRRK